MSRSVLFICTGNIFRSLTAERALRAHLRAAGGTGIEAIAVGSAGLLAEPQDLHPAVADRLAVHGLDTHGHVQRRLTAEILSQAGVAVAMGEDHVASVSQRFGRRLPLFSELAFGETAGLPDVWEAVPDYQKNPAAAAAHIHATVDRIVAGTPALMDAIRQRLGEPG